MNFNNRVFRPGLLSVALVSGLAPALRRGGGYFRT